MLLILLLHISQALVILTAGQVLGKLPFIQVRGRFNTLFLGLCGLILLSNIAALFLPINAYFHLGLLLAALLFQIKKGGFRNLKPFLFQTNILWIVIPVLLLSIGIPNHGDSDFYHAQALQWAEQYPVIPGLGNFFGRLAFNSSFFRVQVLFSLHPFSAYSSHYLNSFLVAVVLVYFFATGCKTSHPRSQRVLAIGFGLCTLVIGRGWVSSVAPDVCAGIMMIWLAWNLALHFLFNHTPNRFLIGLVFVCGVMVKLSVVLYLPLIIAIWLPLNKSRFIQIMLLAACFIPWLIQNFMLSGYWVYPFFTDGITQPDWQVPAAQALLERQTITAWARAPGASVAFTMSLPFLKWFPNWVLGQNVFNLLILFVLGFTIVLQMLRLVMGKISALRWHLPWIIGIVVWLITAPDFRFGYALILPYLMICCFEIEYLKSFLNRLNLTWLQGLIPVAAILLMLYVCKKEQIPVYKHMLFPMDYPTITAKPVNLQGVTLYLAQAGDNCNNQCIPCVNAYFYKNHIELRGQGLRNGFRQKKGK